MKKIEAIIQPFKVDDVRDALKEAGVDGMTVTDVKGHGRQRGHVDFYRGQEYKSALHPKSKIEVVVGDRDLDEAIAAIIRGARSGKLGDGKIFIFDIVEAIRIRNGNRDEAAV